MNQFYLNNSYTLLLDSTQLLSDNQGIVYFKLPGLPVETSPPLFPGGNLPGPLDTSDFTGNEIISAQQAEPDYGPGIGPIDTSGFQGNEAIGAPAAENAGLEVMGSPADSATGLPSGTPIGGGSGY